MTLTWLCILKSRTVSQAPKQPGAAVNTGRWHRTDEETVMSTSGALKEKFLQGVNKELQGCWTRQGCQLLQLQPNKGAESKVLPRGPSNLRDSSSAGSRLGTAVPASAGWLRRLHEVQCLPDGGARVWTQAWTEASIFLDLRRLTCPGPAPGRQAAPGPGRDGACLRSPARTEKSSQS